MTSSLKQAARAMAGNWRDFKGFAWNRPEVLDHADDWCLVYTHHRDSGLTDQSNAAAIDAALRPSRDSADLFAEHHFHWAVGWVEGYAVRVYRGGRITPVFRVWYGLARRIARDELLDEADHAARQCEAAVENIAIAGWRFQERYDLPAGWEQQVFTWLWDHRDSALQDCDDQGGCPSEEHIEAALQALGLIGRTRPARQARRP